MPAKNTHCNPHSRILPFSTVSSRRQNKPVHNRSINQSIHPSLGPSNYDYYYNYLVLFLVLLILLLFARSRLDVLDELAPAPARLGVRPRGLAEPLRPDEKDAEPGPGDAGPEPVHPAPQRGGGRLGASSADSAAIFGQSDRRRAMRCQLHDHSNNSNNKNSNTKAKHNTR